MGIFYPFRNDAERQADRRRGGGHRDRHGDARGQHLGRAASACSTATRPTSCRTNTGQIRDAHSIAAGLDYPGVGPEHSYFKKTGRADYVSVEDR